jgi:hypothetical protein
MKDSRNGEREMTWTFHRLDELPALSATWDSINSQNANSPILDARFFHLLLEMLVPGEVTLAVCEMAGTPIAATMLTKVKIGVWQTVQPPQAPLGAWVQHRSLDVSDLLTSLSSALRGSRLLLSISQLDPDIVVRPVHSDRLETLDYLQVPRLTIAGSFDEYWSSRGKNLVKNLKRQINRLDRESIRARYEWNSSPSEVASAVDDYGVLESAGWKSKLGTALHPENVQGRFYRELLRTYAARNEGLALRYFYNDALVASDLCLCRDGIFYLLKTTYDELQQTTSPSSLMRYETMKRLFDSGAFTRVEFYGRVMDWHRKWTNEFRSVYHVNYFPSRLARRVHSLRRAWLLRTNPSARLSNV